MLDHATPLFIGSKFEMNNAISQGGAVITNDFTEATFKECEFRTNVVQTGEGGGIAIVDFSEPVLNGTIFAANEAQNGGAVYSTGEAAPVMLGCTLDSNTAVLSGGGASFAGNSSALVEDCDIRYLFLTRTCDELHNS